MATPETNSDGLQVRDLIVRRGGRLVLESVSLDLHPGEVTCLLGANGAGKSTLIMTIAGVLPVSDGSINSMELRWRDTRRRPYASAALPLFPRATVCSANLSVLDNLRAAGSALSRAALKEEIDQVIEIFPELTPRLSLDAHLLSGGQKQMVAIGQALIARPRYLFIDELSFGLAPAVVVRLGDTIRAISSSRYRRSAHRAVYYTCSGAREPRLRHGAGAHRLLWNLRCFAKSTRGSAWRLSCRSGRRA